MPLHLQATAPTAPQALLPGDPGRALLLAQELLVKPLMSNHARGLWGYYGETPDGAELTIQSTGIGGPSTALVVRELHELGVRRAVRVGTCGALVPDLRLGEVLIAGSAICDDGTSRAIGGRDRVEAAAGLTASLAAAAADATPPVPVTTGPVVSTDLFYSDGAADEDGDPDGRGRRWAAAGALAVEMEAAALFALGSRLGIEAGCILTPSDELHGEGRRRLDDAGIAEAGLRIGRIAAAALRR